MLLPNSMEDDTRQTARMIVRFFLEKKVDKEYWVRTGNRKPTDWLLRNYFSQRHYVYIYMIMKIFLLPQL